MDIYYWKENRWLSYGHDFPDSPPTPRKVHLEKEFKKLPITIPYDRSKSVEENLELCFEVLNGPVEPNPLGHSIYQKWIRENLRPHPHTSMSVGDIVHVGEHWYIVGGIGFDKLPW